MLRLLPARVAFIVHLAIATTHLYSFSQVQYPFRSSTLLLFKSSSTVESTIDRAMQRAHPIKRPVPFPALLRIRHTPSMSIETTCKVFEYQNICIRPPRTPLCLTCLKASEERQQPSLQKLNPSLLRHICAHINNTIQKSIFLFLYNTKYY